MENKKIYYTMPINQESADIFLEHGYEIMKCSGSSEDSFIRDLEQFRADALICRTDPVTAAVMDASPNLKVIGKQGAGLDNIDMDHARSKGIQVVYTPAGNANAVAEHAMLLILACAKRFAYVDEQFRKGDFFVRMGIRNCYELGGMTLGVIGCGRISSLLMKKAKNGFGMRVIGYDPYVTQDKIGDLCELKKTAKEVWEEADFVSIHLPVVESTKRSIGREQFSWMKPKASFINCARGALVREEELIECLKDGTLFQAGLDVFDQEPIKPESSELYDLSNAILTPHMAATTEQAIKECCISVANDVIAVCEGRPPRNPAYKPDY